MSFVDLLRCRVFLVDSEIFIDFHECRKFKVFPINRDIRMKYTVESSSYHKMSTLYLMSDGQRVTLR